jgi:predicted Zn-dependent protease
VNLTESDKFHIRAAQGWLGLGSHIEADAELDNVTPQLRALPVVLELRFQIYAKATKWDAARDIADAITKQLPDYAGGWLHLAYATRRMTGGSVEAAFGVLRPAADRFPQEPTIPYNLACYSCKMGKKKEAWNWLEKAFDIAPNPAELKSMALDDPDLEPLWMDIAEI